MVATVFHKGRDYRVDLFQPIDISMPLHTGADCASAWYVEPMKLEPVTMGDWIGDVNSGGSVNFRTLNAWVISAGSSIPSTDACRDFFLLPSW